MLLLVTLALIGAAASEPQAVLPFGYGYGYGIMANGMAPSIYPAMHYSGMPAASIHSIPAAIPASPGIIPMGSHIIYPSFDIATGRSSPMMPKQVEDTPEVKKAKMDFEMAYSKAMMGMNEGTPTPTVRAKRDVTRVMPYGYSLPYSGYTTPYGHFSHAVSSSPVLPSNVIHTPYFSHL